MYFYATSDRICLWGPHISWSLPLLKWNLQTNHARSIHIRSILFKRASQDHLIGCSKTSFSSSRVRLPSCEKGGLTTIFALSPSTILASLSCTMCSVRLVPFTLSRVGGALLHFTALGPQLTTTTASTAFVELRVRFEIILDVS